MSHGSRVQHANEAERAAADKPPRPTDVVVVKLKADAPRPATPRGVRGTLGASAGGGLFERLQAWERVQEVTPVFPTASPPRTLAVRAAAEAPAPPWPGKRSRGLTLVKARPGVDAEALARELAQERSVEYAYVPAVKYPLKDTRARPPRLRRAVVGPDPMASRQWSHAAVRVHKARAVQGFNEADGVTVAIVDTGVDSQHPDLVGSIASYQNFLSASEGDDDFVGHGTHVAGIVAAQINNSVGVAGLCRARLAIMKALPRRGAPWNATAYYRALWATVAAGARVLNLSLGGGEDPGERDVILDLIDQGVVVVAAMGNEYEKGNATSYPAAYKGVIAVGATDEVDRRAPFSCTGKHISLVAPGERILSTVPRQPSELAAATMYDSWPGTSMAAPHVAAAAALLLARRPALTPARVQMRLCLRADKVKWQKKTPDPEYGWGRLNIARVLR